MKFTIVALLQIFLVFIFPTHNDGQDETNTNKTVVTVAQYTQFCVETGRKKPGEAGWCSDYWFVVNIDWKDATALSRWLSK